MPRWPSKNKKEEEDLEEDAIVKKEEEIETPLQDENVVKATPVAPPIESKTNVDAQLISEVEQHLATTIGWGNDLIGAISRAIEYRTPLSVSEKDISMLDFCMRVVSYADPNEIVEMIKQAETEEK